jgi:hypothetical protein
MARKISTHLRKTHNRFKFACKLCWKRNESRVERGKPPKAVYTRLFDAGAPANEVVDGSTLHTYTFQSPSETRVVSRILRNVDPKVYSNDKTSVVNHVVTHKATGKRWMVERFPQALRGIGRKRVYNLPEPDKALRYKQVQAENSIKKTARDALKKLAVDWATEQVDAAMEPITAARAGADLTVSLMVASNYLSVNEGF